MLITQELKVRKQARTLESPVVSERMYMSLLRKNNMMNLNNENPVFVREALA